MNATGNPKNDNDKNRTDKEKKTDFSTELQGEDIQDSPSDEERLQSDSFRIVLPEVSDIEGQEHVENAAPLGEIADTTASSDDEEGIRNGNDLWADEEEQEEPIVMGTEADVTPEDLQLLGDPDQDMDMGEDEAISTEGLDDTDFEGDPLNEGKSDLFTTGSDLDMPVNDGSNPLADSMGQGDEENDYYSLNDDEETETEDN